MDTLQIRPVVPGTEAWDAALEIYREAFPRKERRSEADQLRALADPLFRTEGIFVDGTLRGIVFYWLFGESRYIEYLAMAPAMRGRNLGSQVLQRFCAGRRVILEIEPPKTSSPCGVCISTSGRDSTPTPGATSTPPTAAPSNRTGWCS